MPRSGSSCCGARFESGIAEWLKSSRGTIVSVPRSGSSCCGIWSESAMNKRV